MGFSKADESHHYTEDGTDSQNIHYCAAKSCFLFSIIVDFESE